MGNLNDQARASLSAEIATHLERDHALSNGVTGQLAHKFCTSRRTVRRLASPFLHDLHDRRSAASGSFREMCDRFGANAFRFDDEAHVLLSKCGGNVAELHRTLVAAGVPVPSYATLRRRYNELSLHDRKTLEQGDAAFYQTGKFVRQNPRPISDWRNLWELDLFILDIEIRHHGQRVRPWLCAAIHPSRFVPCWALKPSNFVSTDVAAMVADGVRIRPSACGTGMIGLAPDLLIVDNDPVFTSAEFQQAVPCNVETSMPYRPHQKAYIERNVGGTVQRWIVSGLPGAIHKAQTIDHYAAYAVPTAHLLTIDQLMQFVSAQFYRFNYRHKHRSLGRRTPAETYLSYIAHWSQRQDD